MDSVYYDGMRGVLRIIVDTIFPPTTHGKLLASVTPEQFVRHYHPHSSQTVISLSRYHTPIIQAAVAACKFEKNIYAAELLATLLTTWLAEHSVTGTSIVVPLPLSYTRQKERGFNQTERVLTYLPKNTFMRIERAWLVRSKDTVRQTSLDRSARLHNMHNAFSITPTLTQADWSMISRVIICDDVLTTGATLNAAKKALSPHLPSHVELVCIAWSH